MYKAIRNVHLFAASLGLPFLLMYGISAVQMGHQSWFDLRPSVVERDVALAPGQADAREVARQLMDRERSVHGELGTVQAGARELAFRIAIPGTVHDLRYDPVSGITHVRTSVGGPMVMLNRMHHAAGLWHGPASLDVWGWGVVVASLVMIVLGATGIYMWFTRQPERRAGIVLLGVNLAAALLLLVLVRTAGP